MATCSSGPRPFGTRGAGAMSEQNTPAHPVSLDDLLRSNKDQFDKVFDTQMRRIDVGGTTYTPAVEEAPPTEETVPVEAETETPPAAPSGTEPMLALAAPETLARVEARPSAEVDPERAPDTITLDLLEGALRNARREMDALLQRQAVSLAIRDQHDAFPTLADAEGRMLAGSFGGFVREMLQQQMQDLRPGDVILQSDPYRSDGAVGHVNDWLVLMPVFYGDAPVGFSAMCGHMVDVGGPVPGSLPTSATSIFGEGMRIPPIKLYAGGEPNRAVLDLLWNNSRTPDLNYADLMALVAACRIGERRLIGICDRFGVPLFRRAGEALRARSERVMRRLIVRHLPEEPQSFEDHIDSDGRGNGPFKIKLTVWREGEQAFFDWTGTAAQAPGPVNFYLHDGLFKSVVGAYLCRTIDPRIQLNDAFYDLIHVTLPKGTLLRPTFPAAVGGRAHAMSRQFDVLTGAMSWTMPEAATAAGCGSSPQFRFAGIDRNGRPFQLVDHVFGGIPGRPVADGIDGHAWQPLAETTAIEDLESCYPVIVESCRAVPDSGGIGKHRGGNAVEKVYRLLEAGEVSIHDDRERSQPWGIGGGGPGAGSAKWIERQDGERAPLPSKIDRLKVRNGDRIIFRTAAGGGWGDPLARDPVRVRKDVVRGLATAEATQAAYGVVLTEDGHEIDARATEELRDEMRRNRRPMSAFDFGERRRDNGDADTS